MTEKDKPKTYNEYIDEINKMLDTVPGKIHKPTIEELDEFHKSYFYHNWRERFRMLHQFDPLGLKGVFAIPNTTFEEWLYYFHEFAEAFVNDYNEFKKLVLEAIDAINKHLEIIDKEIKDIQDHLKEIDKEIKDIQDRLTVIEKEIKEIQEHLKEIDKEITEINNKISDIINTINAMNGNFKNLTRGTDFEVQLYNGWREETPGDNIYVGVAESSEQWIFHVSVANGARGHFLHDDLQKTKFKHSNTVEEVPESRVMLIQFMGDYTEAINGEHTDSTNDSNIINVSPTSARASWSVTYGLFQQKNLNGFLVTLTSIADGYNSQWSLYEDGIKCVGANIGVTFTVRKPGK